MPKRILNFNKYPSYFSQAIWRVFVPLYLKSTAINFKKNIKCYGFPIISKAEGSDISIGNNVVLCSVSKFTELGVYHPVILRTLSKGAILHISDDTGMSGVTICAAKKVILGKSVLLGANVTIMDTDFHNINPENRRHNNDQKQIENKEVIIEDNVFIGANSIILKGAHIGKNSVIGAGSVVTGKIPENAIAAGNPAKVIRNIV